MASALSLKTTSHQSHITHPSADRPSDLASQDAPHAKVDAREQRPAHGGLVLVRWKLNLVRGWVVAVGYNILQCNIIRYNIIRYNNLQYYNPQYDIIQYNIIQYNIIQSLVFLTQSYKNDTIGWLRCEVLGKLNLVTGVSARCWGECRSDGESSR